VAPSSPPGGLLFIGATNYDKKFRAFDKSTGKLLWETTLPFAGNTPLRPPIPSTGRQYVVIAAGGGKDPKSPSGGVYVAFRSPHEGSLARSAEYGIKRESAGRVSLKFLKSKMEPQRSDQPAESLLSFEGGLFLPQESQMLFSPHPSDNSAVEVSHLQENTPSEREPLKLQNKVAIVTGAATGIG